MKLHTKQLKRKSFSGYGSVIRTTVVERLGNDIMIISRPYDLAPRCQSFKQFIHAGHVVPSVALVHDNDPANFAMEETNKKNHMNHKILRLLISTGSKIPQRHPSGTTPNPLARKGVGVAAQLFHLAVRWLHSLLPFVLKKAPLICVK